MEPADARDVLDAASTFLSTLQTTLNTPLGTASLALITNVVSTLGDALTSVSKACPDLIRTDLHDDPDLDVLLDVVVEYMRSKACKANQSFKRAREHNERLGPSYWCKSSCRSGEPAIFDDFFEVLRQETSIIIPSHHVSAVMDDVEATYELFAELHLMTDSLARGESFFHLGHLFDTICDHERRVVSLGLANTIVACVTCEDLTEKTKESS